jgi:polyhydroxyalkanoate synthase
MYLNNLLKIPNSLKLLGTSIDLTKIDCSSFFIAAKDDHIAPWSSVYEGMKLLNGNKIFCLTESGHVAGIVNPPNISKYSYKINEDLSSGSDEWLAKSKECPGSWWLYWKDWLIAKSGELEESIEYSNLDFIEPAPGSYVKATIY